MHTVYQLPPGVMSAMVARVKLLGRMDAIEKRRPLDGRIRCATCRRRGRDAPVDAADAFGEKMVMRICSDTVKTLESLGFGNHDGRRWEGGGAAARDRILVAGPTGSGKTTTLYRPAPPGDRRGQRPHDRGRSG
jgi:general secretion pathway protein E